jgi:hypothetical protein
LKCSPEVSSIQFIHLESVAGPESSLLQSFGIIEIHAPGQESIGRLKQSDILLQAHMIDSSAKLAKEIICELISYVNNRR